MQQEYESRNIRHNQKRNILLQKWEVYTYFTQVIFWVCSGVFHRLVFAPFTLVKQPGFENNVINYFCISVGFGCYLIFTWVKVIVHCKITLFYIDYSPLDVLKWRMFFFPSSISSQCFPKMWAAHFSCFCCPSISAKKLLNPTNLIQCFESHVTVILNVSELRLE